MEISKEKLLSLISENNYISDIDEMAKFWEKKKPGKMVKSSNIYDDAGNLIGHDMMVDPFGDPDSDRVQIIFTCDIDEFLQGHPEVVKRLKEQYGTFRFSTNVCPKYRPHKDVRVGYPLPGEEGEPIYTRKQTGKDVSTGQKVEGSKKIKTKFLATLRENITRADENFNVVLNQRSVPAIELDNRKYFDRHTDMWSNESVKFTTLSYNVYKSADQFNEFVSARSFGDDTPEMSTEHLARQFNQDYANWSPEEKKGSTTDWGVTDVYSLRRSGYVEGSENEVFLEMTFTVKGELIGENSFNWTVILVNKFAKRKPEQTRVVGRLEPIEFNPGSIVDGKQVGATKTVQLEPGTEFTPEYTIMDNPQIVEGLTATINEFKNKMKSIDPKTVFRKAQPLRSELTGGRRLRESVSGLIDNIIAEIKDNSKDEIYFKSATEAVEHAKSMAERRGFEIDENDWFSEITMGGKYSRLRPGEGKTHSFSVGLTKDGKPQKKNLNISLYGMESGKYELTTYIN
jgi:hypothetical protein